MYRKHGDANVLVLHGGPGAIGGAGDLAKALGAVEVLSYGQSIQSQISEINDAVHELKMNNPVVIGHSWGAWLAYIYASKFPVQKVVLVGCGAFDEKYLGSMQKRRRGKLTDEEQIKANDYFNQLSQGALKDLSGFNELMSKMDAYEMCGHDPLDSFDFDGHKKLMDEIRPLRRSGELLEMGKLIEGEVLVFHGLDDPHPLEGITEPFEQADIPYELFTFDKCGHTPWHERYAKERFYELMSKVISN